MHSNDQHLQRTVGAMKAKGKLWIAIIGVVLGVILLWLGGRRESVKAGDSDAGMMPIDDASQDRLEMEEYRTAIEARVCHLCTRVTGVGNVFAVVNLQGGFSYVYASDVKNTSGGESRQYIIIGSGSDERLVYLSQEVPAILGIGVVCEGGDDPRVQKEVTALISAAFGLSSHKIYVTGGK